MEDIEFRAWPKTPRLFRDIVVTEKIDGTNAAVIVTEDGRVAAQSRKRLITPESDNAGFARWVQDNSDALVELLGPGYHYGEWWGSKIQRGYGLTGGEKRFSLFNTHRHEGIEEESGGLLRTVPVLYIGAFSEGAILTELDELRSGGSVAEPGYMNPEGIITFHSASGQVYKTLIERDELPKGAVAA